MTSSSSTSTNDILSNLYVEQSQFVRTGALNIGGESTALKSSVIMNDNLIVQNGGNLTLQGANLRMNVSSNGQYKIEVQGGGKMNILDCNGAPSNITNGFADANYLFQVNAGASFEMRNSELHRCGYYSGYDNSSGIYIEADDIVINNNTISDNLS